jgi:hypothetical protein
MGDTRMNDMTPAALEKSEAGERVTQLFAAQRAAFLGEPSPSA